VLASLLAFNSAEADSVPYEWSSTTGFLSSTNQTAIETITGQIAFPFGPFWVVPGSMSGTFTYDTDNAAPGPGAPNFTSYFGATLVPIASLFSASGLVGTCTAALGTVTVSDNGGGQSGTSDVVNAFSICAPPFFGTDPWRATGSSVVWVGEGFQNDQNLPMALPPVGAPLPLGLFSFFNAATGENVSIISVNLDFREAVQTVEIDVKPGTDPNAVNPRSRGVIPVAVLGSVDFDAALVDFSTVTFGPGAASPAHDGHVEDVNGDGFVDMVFHFNTQETGIQCGDIEATLTGETFGGRPITGSDTINTVGCPAPAGVTYDFTQMFGNMAVSGTLTYTGIIPASITTEDLNTFATWDLTFGPVVPDPSDPFALLVPFSLSDSDSSWTFQPGGGATFQINASATELIFDLTTPFGTGATLALESDELDNRQFRFSQGIEPISGVGDSFIIADGPGLNQTVFPPFCLMSLFRFQLYRLDQPPSRAPWPC
jgi:hypothetical protein